MPVCKIHSLLSRVKAAVSAFSGFAVLALLINPMEGADFDPYIRVLPVWGQLVSWGLGLQFPIVATLQWLLGHYRRMLTQPFPPWFPATERYLILLPNLLC